MSKPKYYKVRGVDKWVESKHFSTRYIIKENKELERWDVVGVELPTLEKVPLILTNPFTKKRCVESKDIKTSVSPDAVKLIDWACRHHWEVSSAVADLSAEAAQYAKLKFNETRNKSSDCMEGVQSYSSGSSTKYYRCHVSEGEVVSNPSDIPTLTYPTREKAIEALTKRIANKALKGGSFKQDKARARAENTLKWLLEQDDGDKING